MPQTMKVGGKKRELTPWIQAAKAYWPTAKTTGISYSKMLTSKKFRGFYKANYEGKKSSMKGGELDDPEKKDDSNEDKYKKNINGIQNITNKYVKDDKEYKNNINGIQNITNKYVKDDKEYKNNINGTDEIGDKITNSNGGKKKAKKSIKKSTKKSRKSKKRFFGLM